MTGQALYRTIKKFLVSVKVDILDYSGQGGNGAGLVAGKNQRLSVHALKVNSKAL